jgi:hypothetical protein
MKISSISRETQGVLEGFQLPVLSAEPRANELAAEMAVT